MKKNSQEDIVKFVVSLDDGTYIIEHQDGTLERKKNQTDWLRLKALTDEEIEASIKDDPDWSDDWDWGEAVLVMPPKKKPISIRLDEDVLDFFKNEGGQYQRRINAVLRSYMDQKKTKKGKKRA